MIDHGLAPYFGLKQATPSISQMLVMDWDSGDSLPAFQGVALDTEKGKFVRASGFSGGQEPLR